MYFWNSELKIEFIVPEKGRGAAGIVNIKELGLKAIPLRFVNLLLDNPIFVKEDNLEILLPNPVNSVCINSSSHLGEKVWTKISRILNKHSTLRR
jgi:hypothetical protein